MGATLSIIVPTTGRATLEATLESVFDQLKRGDELIVIRDTAVEQWVDVDELCLPYADIYDEVEGGDRGNTARHRGIELSTGSHLAFMDDDDCYLPGALDVMRQYADELRPVIFRMRHHPHQVIIPFENEWGQFKFGNVGTPCFVVPNVPSKLGEWKPWDGNAGSDFNFINGCCANMGAPIWRREITSIVRPHENVLGSG